MLSPSTSINMQCEHELMASHSAMQQLRVSTASRNTHSCPSEQELSVLTSQKPESHLEATQGLVRKVLVRNLGHTSPLLHFHPHLCGPPHLCAAMALPPRQQGMLDPEPWLAGVAQSPGSPGHRTQVL